MASFIVMLVKHTSKHYLPCYTYNTQVDEPNGPAIATHYNEGRPVYCTLLPRLWMKLAVAKKIISMLVAYVTCRRIILYLGKRAMTTQRW